MNVLKILGAISFLLVGANAFGGYAYCTVGSDLSNPIMAEVVGEKIQRPRVQLKRDLRPMVKRACEQALRSCKIERSKRINRVAYRTERPNPRFRQRIRRLQNSPCQIQQASVKGRSGNDVYTYNRMIGKKEFKNKSLPSELSFARTELALLPGESVQTQSMTLVMQEDGNLVLYKKGRAVWSSWDSSINNSNRPTGLRGHVAVFQKDGNLVVYNMRHQPVFDTVTYNSGVVKLRINRRGNMQLINRQGWVPFNTNGDSEL